MFYFFIILFSREIYELNLQGSRMKIICSGIVKSAVLLSFAAPLTNAFNDKTI